MKVNDKKITKLINQCYGYGYGRLLVIHKPDVVRLKRILSSVKALAFFAS